MIENNPKVTVICTAYNHEKYIRKTLEGFVMQKTNFPFQIIIHDDASNDKTADIIKEFSKKHQKTFIPILQKENQMSKRINIFDEYIFPLIKSDYVAICEGDDYWIDPLKLQKQYDALENNPNCGMCVHITQSCDEDGNIINEFFPSKSCGFNKTKIIKKEEMIETLFSFNSYPFQTSSYFYRIDEDNDLINKLPHFDRYLMLSIASKHDFFFINEKMSVYRRFSKNSWSSKRRTNTFTRDYQTLNFITSDLLFDKETNFNHHKKVIYKVCKDLSYTSKTYPIETKQTIKNNKIHFTDFLSNIGLLETLKVYFSIYFPNLSMKIRNFK